MESELPLVSIGMPVYNGARYIRRALDSLLAQDYEKFEIIISDNASTDQTPKILEQYASKYPHLRIYTQLENVGAEENFIVVLKLARGEYFMWAAHDDYWLPTFVSTLVNELNNHHDSGGAMCAWQCVGEDGTVQQTVRFLGKESPNSKSFLKIALALAYPHTCSHFFYALFRRALLLSATKFLPGIQSSDRWMLFELSLASRFRYVDTILHIRTVYAQKYHERYPLDELVKSKIEHEQKWFYFKTIPAVARMIFQSAIIPRSRKIYIIIILPYLAYRQTQRGMRRIKQRIKRFFRSL
jgi:glycosyltransferase involved in cell wall biosynthesis